MPLKNTEYGEIVSLRIQSECGKMRTRITPNTDTFHAMKPLRYVTVSSQDYLLKTVNYFCKNVSS